MATKTGRPEMSPARKRTRVVRVKVSRIELFDMKRKAKDCGMPLATWLRVTGLASARGL